MPIVWGINASKVFVAVWTIVLIAALIILQLYVVGMGWWLSALYCIALIVFPLLIMLKKLYNAKRSADYHQISSLVKLIMFTGILSMLFFRYYQ
jgi:4-hydroxybenzoate polyprenyltransferase